MGGNRVAFRADQKGKVWCGVADNGNTRLSSCLVFLVSIFFSISEMNQPLCGNHTNLNLDHIMLIKEVRKGSGRGDLKNVIIHFYKSILSSLLSSPLINIMWLRSKFVWFTCRDVEVTQFLLPSWSSLQRNTTRKLQKNSWRRLGWDKIEQRTERFAVGQTHVAVCEMEAKGY